MALLAAGVGPGDEVICPNLTFISPANMIVLTGAEPVLVDIDPRTLNIDLSLLDHAISERTKAVVVVHQFGTPVDMSALTTWATRNGLKVIEDVAEALGGIFEGVPLGCWGDFACFSFFGNKIITSGEGGMVLCKRHSDFEFIQTLRDHGMTRTRRYFHDFLGFNYSMTNLQAAF